MAHVHAPRLPGARAAEARRARGRKAALGRAGRGRREGLLAARVVAVDSSPQGVKVIESD